MTRIRADASVILLLCTLAASLLTLLAALLAYERPDPATTYANNAFENEEYEQALDGFEEVSQKRPGRPEPDYNSAGAQYKLEEYEESAEDLDRALLDAYNMDEESLPDGLAASTQFNLGNVLFQLGEERMAVDQYQEARDQYRKAIDQYKEVLKEDSDAEDAKHNLELALRRIEELEQEQQQQEQQQQQQDPQGEGDQPGSPDQPDEEGDDEQEGPDGDREGVGEDPEGEQRGDGSEQESPLPERPGTPQEQQEMTPGQALQFLEAVGQNPETLQGYLQRQFVPSSPPERDW